MRTETHNSEGHCGAFLLKENHKARLQRDAGGVWESMPRTQERENVSPEAKCECSSSKAGSNFSDY